MKAAILPQYGPPSVVRVEEVARPTAGGHQLLIKNHAVAVTAADARIRAARFPKVFGVLARLAFGLAKPHNKVLGGTFSGVVEQGTLTTAIDSTYDLKDIVHAHQRADSSQKAGSIVIEF